MKVFAHSLVLGLSVVASAQDIEPFLRGFADNIIEESNIAFVNSETGQAIEASKDRAPQAGLATGSPCASWSYTSAMLCDGLYALGKALNEEAYTDFVLKNHEFLFDNMSFIKESNAKNKTRISGLSSFGRFGGVWGCGPQGGAVLNSYLINKEPAYLDYVKETATHLAGIRSREKTEPETQAGHKGLDGVYAYVATMARLGHLTGEKHYFDFCVELVKETELFYEPGVKLYAQAYYPDLKVTNNVFWLRGMGWTAVALVELLTYLPQDHPEYQDVLSIYQQLMVGIAQYQASSGLWHHLVNRTDSFQETSGSIFIVYAFAKGLNQGWLPERYRDVAMTGWRGMMSKRTDDGSIDGNTGSVRTSASPAYHLNNSTKKTDAYLSGPLFLAGTEMLKLYNNPENRKPTTGRWTFTHDPAAINEATN
ncbi:glycoside hydrolase family 88 protein [Planctomycetota bacterium]